jgi:hypothetical protein
MQGIQKPPWLGFWECVSQVPAGTVMKWLRMLGWERVEKMRRPTILDRRFGFIGWPWGF